MYLTSRGAKGVLVAVGVTVLLAGCGPQSEAGQPSSPTVTKTVTGEQSESPAEDAPADQQPASDDLVPCTTDVVEPEMAAGDHSQPDVWNSAVVVTNVGTADCRLEGVSDITFIAPSGDPYDIAQTTIEEGAPVDDLVVVAPGEKASMYLSYASAAEDAMPENCSPPVSAVVQLPDDEQPLEVWHPESADAMPPLCGGPVSVSPWAAGGF